MHESRQGRYEEADRCCVLCGRQADILPQKDDVSQTLEGVLVLLEDTRWAGNQDRSFLGSDTPGESEDGAIQVRRPTVLHPCFAVSGFPHVTWQNWAGWPQGSAWVEVVLNEGESGKVRFSSSRSWSLEEYAGADPRADRQPWQCFAILPNLPAGTHHIGIQGAASVLRAAMFSWSLTLQAYYRHV